MTAGPPVSHRLDIQGLRALAVIGVIAFHAGIPLPGGFAGVDVFFVISGFVITQLLLRRRAQGQAVRLRSFYAQRFKRLTPALGLVVLVTILASILLLAPFGDQQVAAKTGVGAMLLMANAAIATSTGGYFEPAADRNPLLHTWSLSVEEQFYLVFPALLLLGLRRSRPLAAALVGALGTVSFASMFVSNAWPFGFYSPVTRSWEFATGALLGLYQFGKGPIGRLAPVAGPVGLVLIVGSYAMDASQSWPGLATLIPVAGTALCLASWTGMGDAPVVSRFLAWKPLVLVGDYSYSLYLWHWPFIAFARLLSDSPFAPPLAAAAAIVPAWLSYRFVEQPLRGRPMRGWRSWLTAIATVVVLPLIASAGLWVGARAGWGIPQITALNKGPTHPGFEDCLRLDTQGTGDQPIKKAACTFNGDSSGKPIFLVGDSNAAVYSTPALAAAKQLGRPLIVRTAAACSFTDLFRVSGRPGLPDDKRCREYFDETRAEIRSSPAGADVIIAESSSQWLLEGRGFTTSLDSTARYDFASRDALLTSGLAASVDLVVNAGDRAVLIEPTELSYNPHTTVALVSCTSTLSIVTGTCPVSAPIADMGYAAEQKQLRATVATVAQTKGARFIPVVDRQCPQDVCSPTVAGVPVLMDSGHLSPGFALQLTDRFLVALS